MDEEKRSTVQYLPSSKQIHHGQPPFEHLRPASVTLLLPRPPGRPPAKDQGGGQCTEKKHHQRRDAPSGPPLTWGVAGEKEAGNRAPPTHPPLSPGRSSRSQEPSTWAARPALKENYTLRVSWGREPGDKCPSHCTGDSHPGGPPEGLGSGGHTCS